MKLILDIEKYFMIPSFLVIANYPEPKNGTHYKKGDKISPSTLEYCEPFFEHPDIFKRLKWWEMRSTAELLKIKAIEVITPSYYVKGDKVPVSAYQWEGLETIEPKIIGFYVGGSFRDGKFIGGHVFGLTDCIPTQEATMKVH